MKHFFTLTLGCKVNQYETDGIASELIKNGWTRVQEAALADMAIVNTCTVTSRAAMQSRQAIRAIIRKHPGIRVIVTGCYAQTGPDEIRKISGVDAVVGHKDKFTIAHTILSGNDFPGRVPETDRVFRSFEPAVSGSKTRAYLKIQDGCNAFCNYCIVPYARGRSRSMPEDDVMEHLSRLDAKGYQEAIITGIHTGVWGQDFDRKSTLEHLLRSIIQKRPITRIRLSSIEPKELNDGIIQLAKEERGFCDHFHIPLQSGDDEILRRMGRPYDTGYFRELVLKINHEMPFAGMGVDLLLGFPGESDAAFDRSCQLIQDLPVSYLHVFPFSPREGTPAFNYKDKVHSETLKKRCAVMRSIGEEKRRKFENRNIGRSLTVVVQEKRDKSTGLLKGVSSNYITLLFDGPDTLKSRTAEVLFKQRDKEGNLKAELPKAPSPS